MAPGTFIDPRLCFSVGGLRPKQHAISASILHEILFAFIALQPCCANLSAPPSKFAPPPTEHEKEMQA